jgi:hypothetical protein
MFPKMLTRLGFAVVLSILHASAQPLTINGVNDRGMYNDTVTFNILAQSGYTYSAFLNTNPIPAGQVITINRPDFYQLYVERTEVATSQVLTRLVQFIVEASERENTEWGLPPQTPFPVIQSSSNEFAGAHLDLVVPQDFPTGYEIPVVAWAVDNAEHAVRANGLVTAAGHPSIQVRRGVGSGFLSANHAAGPLTYAAQLQGLQTNKTINLESNTAWTIVSGVLNGNVAWPDNARIYVITNLTVAAGATLTIGAGTIVRVNYRTDITNNGSILINGTVERPVVFMPNSRTEPWGGFILRTASSQLTGTGAIFTGSGGDPCWFDSQFCDRPGQPGSHRSEQALFFCSSTPSISLTDSAAMYLAGQLGHAVNGGTFRFNRFLMQRCTTGGEYTGANFTVNDSAFIECPDDSADFVDGDNDALYFVSGNYNFTNTLVGWTKDDGIDSGGSGYGPLNYQSCWFEATFHEGNSLSGYKNTLARDTVYLDCGQGIEDGYNAPTGRVDHCLFVANKVGVRHGDNYDNNGNYDGRITATNCLILNNHRDVFGYNWHLNGGWTNASGQMFINNNLLTVPDTNFPNNSVWNPTADAWRLGAFGARGHVGVALGTRTGQAMSSFPDGLPVGLSTFCTNEVVVDYAIDASDGTSLSDTLRFAPGQVRRFIPLPPFTGLLRVVLSNPQNADLTGVREAFFQNLPPTAPTLVARSSVWKYLDTATNEPAGWKSPGFDDSTWPSGPGTFGYGDGPEGTTLRPTTSPPNPLTYYFRTIFSLADTSTVGSLLFTVRRDDGVVAYLNGFELFRMNMPLTNPITYGTFASISAPDETSYFPTNLSATALRNGLNVLAVELHQQSATSGDAHFDLDLIAQPLPGGALLNITTLTGQPVVYWNDPTYSLEQAPEVTGTWTNAAPTSPTPVDISDPRRFYRLKKP